MKWLMSAGFFAVFGLAGCGSDTTGGAGGGGGATPAAGCNTDPWSCPAGQTCTIAAQGTKFTCLNGGAGKAGDTCKNIIDQPQCGDGLTCFQIQGDADGVCSPFCDPSSAAHACPNSAACVMVQFGSAGIVKICQPDGGAGGAGGNGSATSTATGAGGAGGAPGSGGAGGK